MPNIKPQTRDIPEKVEYILGFPKGINKLQDESLIDDSELSVMKNAILVVDGVQKRTGSVNFGSSSGSRIFGAISFYTSAASNNRWMIREGGTSLQYYNASNVPTNITGATMTAGLRTEFAIARDSLYVQNGTDGLVKITISGGVPVASTFTALTTPTNVAISNQGAAGSTTYSYRVSAINQQGETLASVSVTTTTGNVALSTTNFNRVTWNAVSGATGYIIYGRKTVALNGLGESKLSSVGTGITTYDDIGADAPSATILPPEGNSTGGQKGTMIKYALSKLFIAGDPANPSRLYYSAGSTQIEDFSSAYGGGWIDVSKNDGDVITAIEFYQNKVIVFKHRSVWQFSFSSTGLPTLEMITGEVGCESHRTVKIVNNDLWFVARKDGRAAVYSLGNVQNYFNALRTTEQSLKISTGSMLDSANMAQLSNACAYYFRNQYLLCVAQGGSSTNNRVYPYDSRFNAWLGYWDNINANAFFTYQDSSGVEDLYYASDTTGYIVKMFTGTDDNGTAVSWQIQTKNFNQKLFNQYKIYRNPVFWFKDVSSGSITGFIVNDGIFNSGTFNVSAVVSGIGWDYDLWDRSKWDTSLGAATSTANSDQPMEIIFTKLARSIKFELDEASTGGTFKFLGLTFKWLLLEGKPLPSTNRIRLTG